MIIKAEQKNSRQTPTRLRLVAKAVKRLSVKDAMDQLTFMNKKAAKTMLQVFKQAVANATKNLGLSYESLTIKDIVVNEGPRFKRFRPVSRGQAHSILKRTSHVRVVLESKETEVKKPVAQKKTVMPEKQGEVKPVVQEGEVLARKPQQAPVVEKRVAMKSQTTTKTVSVRKTGER